MTRGEKKKLFVAFDTGDELIASEIVRIIKGWFGNAFAITFSAQFSYGTNWRTTLYSRLQRGDVLLAICTRRSLSNRWIHFEAGAFWGRRKKVMPVTMSGLRPGDLSEPLSAFQAPDLESEDDMARFCKQLAKIVRKPCPVNPGSAAAELRAVPLTGVPERQEPTLNDLCDKLHLKQNAVAAEVLNASPYPFRLCVDDVLALFIAPGWDGLESKSVISKITGNRIYPPEVSSVIQKYKTSRSDNGDNKKKVALAKLDPFMTDRDHLGMTFENMRYFDFDGPRRSLYKGIVPTSFAKRCYFGKEIPEKIPTPMVCVHTVLLTRNDEYLILGLRRRANHADFYDNHLCVGFEEQMTPEDGSVFGTVKRGLREETGITSISDEQIRLVGVGLEASFFSIACFCIAHLECDAKKLHDSIQSEAEDHEWDPLFLLNDTKRLGKILGLRLPKWSELKPLHYLQFDPQTEYEWHGTSRFRLFAHLANKEGLGRLKGYFS